MKPTRTQWIDWNPITRANTQAKAAAERSEVRAERLREAHDQGKHDRLSTTLDDCPECRRAR